VIRKDFDHIFQVNHTGNAKYSKQYLKPTLEMQTENYFIHTILFSQYFSQTYKINEVIINSLYHPQTSCKYVYFWLKSGSET